MAIYSQAPGILDVNVVQGDDIEVNFQVCIGNASTPYDKGINDWVIAAWVVTNTGTIVNGLTAIVDSAAAIFKIRYDDATTASLAAGIHSHVVTVTIGTYTRTYVTGFFEVTARGAVD